MNRDITYYLAGPMTGLPEYNYPEFTWACEWLRSHQGLTVASPHEVIYDAKPGELPYNDYIVGGLNLLKTCQGVILLPGWASSNGVVHHELRAARARALPVYYILRHDLGASLLSMGLDQ